MKNILWWVAYVQRDAAPKWRFPKIGVPPNHPILIGFALLNHPFGGTPVYGNPQICKRAVSQKFLSFYVGEQRPQIMCGCIAVCGSTLVLVMSQGILCNKRSRKTRDLFFTVLLPVSTVRATSHHMGSQKEYHPVTGAGSWPNWFISWFSKTFIYVFFFDVDVPVRWNYIIDHVHVIYSIWWCMSDCMFPYV